MLNKLASMFYVLFASVVMLNSVHAFAGHQPSMVVSSESLRKIAAATKKLSGNQSTGRTSSQPRPSLNRDGERMEWINRSVEYYTKVMREERRRNIGQLPPEEGPEQREGFIALAKKHYFARYKIKNGMPRHAEQIYRRIIDELSHEEEGQCDHAKLAVATLLLALLLQRQGDIKGTRSVFLSFFRIAVLEMDEDKECACSAKVLQAYALFEMKRGNSLKSLELATKAIKLDSSLASIMQWKQFRDAKESRENFMARAAMTAAA